MAEHMRISLAGQVDLGPLGSLAFAFLVTERHRPVPRDELAEVLWGDVLPSTWEPSLRSVVSRVRRQLEATGAAITSVGGCYRLEFPAGTVVDVEEAAADVDEATAALARGDWKDARRRAAAAADVAGRGFLPGAGGLWVEQRQADLAELRVRALETLADAASAAGDHASALQAAEAAVGAQPLRESAHVRVITAHAAAGNPGAALRAYERCRAVLAEELGASPSERTEAVYLALLAGDDPAAGNESPPTNLRADLSSFVGRTEQRRTVEKLLGTTRLLTLVGPGGVGKTRLATRVAADLVGRYPDGVWLVELAALADGALLPQHVMSTLALAEKAGSTPLESLCDHLARRELLLVLDNCEHLSASCAALVRDVLRAGPRVVVLATSRERLGVPGESLLPVPPLSLPDPDGGRPWDAESVLLFVERASAIDPELNLSEDTAPAVADICRRLDGVPLAIELAAARVRSLSVSEIAERVRDRFRLLVGRDPTAPDRHQTLRAAVDWSYDALTPAEQVLFRRTSVFAGGFTLDSAAAVCASPEDPDVLDTLSSLVDKSLVIADRAGSATRYRLLETLRQYGAERLSIAAEEHAVRGRHLAWVRSIAEAAEDDLGGPEQAAALRRLDAETDNVRAALDWAEAHPTGEDGLRAAGALWRYWEVRRREEGSDRLRRLLAASTDVPAPVRAKALISTAVLLLGRRGHQPEEIRSLFEESLAIHRATGDERGMATALHGLGGFHFQQLEFTAARACFEETLTLGRRLGNPRLVAASLNNLANVAQQSLNVGAVAPAGLDPESLYEESLALWREIGDEFAVSRVLADLGVLATRSGRWAAASAHLSEGAAIQRRLGSHSSLFFFTARLAYVAQRQADYAGARSILEEVVSTGREASDRQLEARGLLEIGEVWWAEGDLVEAQRLHEESAAVARTLEDPWALYNALNGLGALAMLRDDLVESRRLFEEAVWVIRLAPAPKPDDPWAIGALAVVAWAEGNRTEAIERCGRVVATFVETRNRPHSMAMALDVLAVATAETGAFEQAARLWGAADGIRGVTGNSFAPFRLAKVQASAIQAVRHGLGEDSYAATVAAGAALGTEDVLALAESVLGGTRGA